MMTTLFANVRYADEEDRPFGLKRRMVTPKRAFASGRTCRNCKGYGTVRGEDCLICEGRGYVVVKVETNKEG